MKERHMIPFELPAYFFHRLMNELSFGIGMHKSVIDPTHDPKMCLELYRMLAAQVGTPVAEVKGERYCLRTNKGT